MKEHIRALTLIAIIMATGCFLIGACGKAKAEEISPKSNLTLDDLEDALFRETVQNSLNALYGQSEEGQKSSSPLSSRFSESAKIKRLSSK